MIYVSTGGMSTIKALDACKIFEKVGINDIELSGGKSDAGQVEKLIELDSRLNLSVHNYFPPPEVPFVFNLASEDSFNLQRSIKHAKTAIALASKLKSKVYSLHAGFLVELSASELGSKIKKRRLLNRTKAIKRFVHEVQELADYAGSLGVRLLIENNVIAKSVYQEFGSNPLLMSDKDECIHMMKELGGSVGLLVDVGHLNVSANTLGFSKEDFMRDCSPYIEAYHLSENDGMWDSNKALKKESWFWEYLRDDLSYYSLEVYNETPETLATQVDLAHKMICI